MKSEFGQPEPSWIQPNRSPRGFADVEVDPARFDPPLVYDVDLMEVISITATAVLVNVGIDWMCGG